MNEALYDLIFKRKSFHLFRDIGDQKISLAELQQIEKYFSTISPLVQDIKVKIRIVKDIPTCARGQQYCILFYSETKPNYLPNLGYMLEQLDLYLASQNIGTLIFGIGKPDEICYDGLDFVIMMAIAKVDSAAKFRKDMFKSKRKKLEEIWLGEEYLAIGNIVRFAPSSCNLQPWLVEATPELLRVYRYRNPQKRGIMPANKVDYYSQIDIGIFLCFLELCLLKNKLEFDRVVCQNDEQSQTKNLTALYKIKC
ncbi:MAG: nitroreductase family protein [Erysipelotrichaceae bacterium]